MKQGRGEEGQRTETKSDTPGYSVPVHFSFLFCNIIELCDTFVYVLYDCVASICNLYMLSPAGSLNEQHNLIIGTQYTNTSM